MEARADRRPPPAVVKGLPLLGSAIPFGRDPVGALLRWHRELGPVFRVQVANKTYTVLGGVEANRFITASKYEAITNFDTLIGVMADLGTHKNMAVLEGEEHMKHRAAAQASYSRGAMARFMPFVHETLHRFVHALPEGRVTGHDERCFAHESGQLRVFSARLCPRNPHPARVTEAVPASAHPEK